MCLDTPDRPCPYPIPSCLLPSSSLSFSSRSSLQPELELSPCSHRPGHLRPPFVHFLPREPPQPCSAPPRALLEPSPAGIDGPIADRHGSAARAPPLRVDPLLRSSSTQIDHVNGFLVSSSTFPTPFPALFPCRASLASPATMASTVVGLLFRFARKLWI